MSSFDRFDLLLIKNEHGQERLLWREAGVSEIHECLLNENEMEIVVDLFCKSMRREIESDLQTRST